MSSVSGKSPSLLKSVSPHVPVLHGPPLKTLRKSSMSAVSGNRPSLLKSVESASPPNE
jgi:hypothetical protein